MSGHGRHDYNRCTHSRIAVFFYTNQRLSQGGIAYNTQHSLSCNRRRAGSSAMQQKGVLQMNYSATHTGQSRPRTSTHLLRLCLCLQWVQTSISVLLALAPCPVALRLRWHGYFEFIPPGAAAFRSPKIQANVLSLALYIDVTFHYTVTPLCNQALSPPLLVLPDTSTATLPSSNILVCRPGRSQNTRSPVVNWWAAEGLL